MACNVDCSLTGVILYTRLNGGLRVTHHRLKEVCQRCLGNVCALELLRRLNASERLEQVWPESVLAIHLAVERDVVGILRVHLAALFGENASVHHVLNQPIVEGNQIFLNADKLGVLLLQHRCKGNVGGINAGQPAFFV